MCVFSTQAQDTRGGRNTTIECLSDTLSCATLMLDPDPAAAPDIAQDTDAPEKIQTLITELRDTTSGMKQTPTLEHKMLRASTLLLIPPLTAEVLNVCLFSRQQQAPWGEEEEELRQALLLMDEKDI